MKLNDINAGFFKAGCFNISIQQCAIADFDYFEVYVSELKKLKGLEYLTYVHLVNDERFALFKHIQNFERLMQLDEVTTFNAYIRRKHLDTPTWKLSKYLILNLFDICKKAKPNK